MKSIDAFQPIHVQLQAFISLLHQTFRRPVITQADVRNCRPAVTRTGREICILLITQPASSIVGENIVVCVDCCGLNHCRQPMWIYILPWKCQYESIQADRLVGKASSTNELRFQRSKVLKSLRNQEQSQRVADA